ncbi:hypothetical protein Y032_0110g177 [Ancylostoma ceylanicum]|uniref:Uncharacterized protein n=1 Tax=Ancylostoma ceylanicum TaxID=53326 RepID=A0A016TEQ2_9BILA|nr:hypothetical protein Y032_0110g177 [Ancylostoma ceylanicum]
MEMTRYKWRTSTYVAESGELGLGMRNSVWKQFTSSVKQPKTSPKVPLIISFGSYCMYASVAAALFWIH